MSDELPLLFKKPAGDLSADELKSVVDIYKILIDMADKVSQRRQNANNFYLSVNTAITGAAAYLSAIGNPNANIIIISLAGIIVCVLWKRNIDSYKDLNTGKFRVITEMEKALPVAAFTAEWEVLQRGENKSLYRPFHRVEILVPFIFAAVHLAQCLRLIPWNSIVGLVCR
jgi:predicted homoserine dehydrogenase-like protein